MKTYNVLTIFPEMIESVFKQGVVSKAVEKGIVSINPVNIRDYAEFFRGLGNSNSPKVSFEGINYDTMKPSYLR